MSDNFSSHLVDNFSNIEIFIIPKNTTTFLQQLDSRIFESFKSIFKSKINNFWICGLETKLTEEKNIFTRLNLSLYFSRYQ